MKQFGARQPYMTLRIPKLGVSFLVERQPLWLIACLVLLLFICMLYATGAGSLPIPASDVFKSLIGHGDPLNDLIIREFRLPRVLTAVLAGAALALSGAVMQGMVRNPLASPDLMGITSGAGLAAVVFLNFFSGDWGIHWLPVFAAAGGAIVAGAVFLAAWKGGIAPIRMVLIGVGITALLGSARTIIMLQANIWQAAQSYTWLVGSLHSSSWSSVQMLFICLLVLSPLLFIAVRYINLHALGDEVALGAGSALQRERILLIALLTALAGAAISFVGGISFVALMSPHIARRLVGPSFGAVLPASALIGAMILVTSDLIGRTMFVPLDIPAGIFTALIGAPFFLYLLTKVWSR